MVGSKAENKYWNTKFEKKLINILSLRGTNFTQSPDTMPHCLFLLEILPSYSEAVNLPMSPRERANLSIQ